MEVAVLAQDGDWRENLSRNLAAFWDQTVEFLRTQGTALAMNVAAALVIFVIGRWGVRLVHRFLVRAFTKAHVDETLAKFLANAVYAVLLTVVVIAAISRLGVDTTSFAAIVAAAGLAVGLALQSSLSNFAAGVMIILFRPFKVGDFVETGGTSGIVEEIHIFNTWMRTFDNKQVIIPNGTITAAVITNFSAKPTRRIDLVVSCEYQDDLKAVKEFLLGLLSADGRILKDPAPQVAVDELGNDGVQFAVRPWVRREDYGDVRWSLIEQIKLGFDERGFTIPTQSRDVYLVTNGENDG